jgi:hypothetical protein
LTKERGSAGKEGEGAGCLSWQVKWTLGRSFAFDSRTTISSGIAEEAFAFNSEGWARLYLCKQGPQEGRIAIERARQSGERERAKRDLMAVVCEKGGLFTYFLILIRDSIRMHNARLLDAKRWCLERWEEGKRVCMGRGKEFL